MKHTRIRREPNDQEFAQLVTHAQHLLWGGDTTTEFHEFRHAAKDLVNGSHVIIFDAFQPTEDPQTLGKLLFVEWDYRFPEAEMYFIDAKGQLQNITEDTPQALLK